MNFVSLYNGCLDLVYPPRCLICKCYIPLLGVERAGYWETGAPGQCQRAQKTSFCTECFSGFEPLSRPLCRMCGVEVNGAARTALLCGDCLKEQPPFTIARSLYRYTDTIQTLIHKLKFTNDLSILPGVLELVAGQSLDEFGECDIILPVPLHKTRLRQRGYNQSVLLARLFFPESKNKLFSRLLERTENTVPQTSLGGRKRRKSLRNCFAARENNVLKGAVVCLVDDVYTTGTTVIECTRTLLRAGAISVKVLTLARVENPRSKLTLRR